MRFWITIGSFASCDEGRMKFVGELLGAHLARYPGMELQDIYKLLHQAALGSGHAVKDETAARAALAQEIADLVPATAGPLSEVISPDGKLLRVHLRAYLNAGGDVDALADAFVRSAREYPGSAEKLCKFCGCLGDLAAAGGIPYSRDETVAYFERIAAQQYPVVHHSPAYRQAHRPAYRVICSDYLTLPA
jgi:hypothetical protein